MLFKIFIYKSFKVNALEYFDENGIFHYQDRNSKDGFISRSKYNDKRNVNGKISYSSTIVDAIKFKY